MRCTLLLLFLACIVTPYAHGASILIIESYHKEYPWTDNCNKGIRSIIRGKHDIQRFYMDTKRLPATKFDEAATQAWNSYLALKPDLVILADDNAISRLSERLGKTDTPVIFLGMNANPRRYGIHKLANFTGALERPIFKRSLLLVDQLLKDLPNRKILVLFDSGHTSVATLEHINRSNSSMTIGRSQVEFELVSNITQWKSLIKQSKTKGFDAIFIGLYHTIIDENADYVAPDQIMQWTKLNSPLPHFGFWDFSISSNGNIGGYVLDGFLHGQLAGELAMKVLSGTPVSKIPYLHDKKGQYMFSISGVEKWQLDIPEKVREQVIWTN